MKSFTGRRPKHLNVNNPLEQPERGSVKAAAAGATTTAAAPEETAAIHRDRSGAGSAPRGADRQRHGGDPDGPRPPLP